MKDICLGFSQSHSETDYFIQKMILESFITIWQYGTGGEKPIWYITELVTTAGNRG